MRHGFTLIELMIALCAALVLLLILGFGVAGCAVALHNEPGQVFTVKGKETVTSNKSSKYLIYTDKTTYEIEDSWYHWRWDSSDVYGNIEIGKTYSATLQGYRVPFLSWYPNIISPTEVTLNKIEDK